MTKFNRLAELDIRLSSGKPDFNLVGRLNIQNLRISFQIQKTLSWSTNKGTIQVYNISPEKRAKINDYGDEVSLFAGYEQESGTQILFIGDTTTVTHSYQYPDIVTSLQCGDGERYLNQRLISISFSENISATSVLLTIANQLGVDISFLAPTPNLNYKQGFQYKGFAKNGLDKVCKYLGLVWSIQNKRLIIVEENGATTKPPATINQNTGMIGVPERYTSKRYDLWTAGPKEGWKVKTLLKPEIIPGDRVTLKSDKAGVNGLFYVNSVKHSGDTWSQNWLSEWELIAL